LIVSEVMSDHSDFIEMFVILVRRYPCDLGRCAPVSR
jgi:hypothetical protein